MSRPKSRQVGTAGLVLRHRDGTCTRTCRRCGQWGTAPGWRAGLRAARQHAATHAATDARYVGTPWGVPAHELPRTARRRWPLRRLATAVVVLALAALAFTLTLAGVTGHAAPAPPSPPAAPSIAILPTTTIPPSDAPASEGYVPTPAGPPATDAGGTWIPEPDPSPAPTSSSAGGGP
jgi:hypothetical protein